jgi:hypothetical protein
MDLDDRRLIAGTTLDRPPTERTATMDPIYDLWLAERRLHRRARAILRRRPRPESVAA